MSDDPRFMTQEQVGAALTPILGSQADVGIARANRHDPASEILMVIIEVASLSYDAMTQVAGLFETPKILIASKVVPCPVAKPAPCDCAADDEQCEYAPTSTVTIKVRW